MAGQLGFKLEIVKAEALPAGVGFLSYRQGDLERSQEHFTRYREVAEDLLARDPAASEACVSDIRSSWLWALAYLHHETK